MTKTAELREELDKEADKLQRVINSAVCDFLKENGQCKISIGVSPVYMEYVHKAPEIVTAGVTVNITI